MVNRRKFNNHSHGTRSRRLWNLIKRKFAEPEEELTIDQYDVPIQLVGLDPIMAKEDAEAVCPLFTKVDEDARYERHMKPIRKLQEAQNAE